MADQNVTVEAVTDEQVNGQATGQSQGQPTPAPDAGDDGMYVRIPKSNYSHLADDGDFNKVVHLGNQYRDAEKSGLVALGQALADANMDPYTFLAEWNRGEEPQSQAQTQTQAQQQVPQQQQQQVQQGQQAEQQQPGQQGQWVTPDQMKQAVADQVKEQMSQGFSDQRQEADTAKAFDSQDAAINTALDMLGYKSEPMKFSLAGTDQELSPVRDLLIHPAIASIAQRIHAQGLNRNAPDYKTRLYGPMSDKTVQEAKTAIKQVLAMIGLQQLEQEADNQADLPHGTIDQGAPGGRVKKNARDMTEEELKAEVDRHVAQAKEKRRR